jgi:NAD(P)-dependent dehydrogenase (short-subunit alcohol dehydrogenase family)
MIMDYKNVFDLTGKTAVVVGGAGGIGGEIAIAFADCGCNVAVTDLMIQNAEVMEELKKKNVKSAIYSADAFDENSVNDTVQKILNDFKTIDILVNCVGTHVHKSFIDYTVRDWDFVLQGNLKGNFLFCRAIGAHMIERKSGRIINMSSVKGLIGMPDKYSVYCTAKGGVVMFTKGLASEWAKYGITVNALAPTFVLTPMSEKELKQEGDVFKQQLIDRVPMKRLALKRDIALAALYFASEYADFITGQVLFIDGGLTSIQ